MNLAPGPLSSITRSANYKWWVFASVALGLFLTVTDQSGIGIALPRIAEHFGADLPSAQWIALGFIMSTSVMFMPVGRLSDIFGRAHVFMLGFGVFVVAAALGGTAAAFPVLIMAKIIQGIGVAGIEANGMAMVAERMSFTDMQHAVRDFGFGRREVLAYEEAVDLHAGVEGTE